MTGKEIPEGEERFNYYGGKKINEKRGNPHVCNKLYARVAAALIFFKQAGINESGQRFCEAAETEDT